MMSYIDGEEIYFGMWRGLEFNRLEACAIWWVYARGIASIFGLCGRG